MEVLPTPGHRCRSRPVARKQTHQFGSQIVQNLDMIEPRNLGGVRIFRAKFRPGPFFLDAIVGGKKQDLGVGRAGVCRCRERAQSVALHPARSIRTDRRSCRPGESRRDRLAPRPQSAQTAAPLRLRLGRQRLPPHVVVGVWLAIEGEAARDKKNQTEQNRISKVLHGGILMDARCHDTQIGAYKLTLNSNRERLVMTLAAERNPENRPCNNDINPCTSSQTRTESGTER